MPEHIAIVLAVAQALGIQEEVGLRGMLKAPADPGALRVMTFGDRSRPTYFVNGFAANEPTSTLALWHRIEALAYPTDDPVVIINCRGDRVDRTKQFADDFFPNFPAHTIIVMGNITRPITEAFAAGKFQTENLLNMEGRTSKDIMELLEKKFSNRIIYGIGNIHGAGEELVAIIEEKDRLRRSRENVFRLYANQRGGGY